VWAKKLLIETGKVLLDREMDHPVVAEIRELIEADVDQGDTHIADLHVWRVGQQSYACALSVVTHNPTLTAEQVRDKLSVHEEIVHVTVEVHQCEQQHGAPS
jgi:Co/Zn/Cd efflux system component